MKPSSLVSPAAPAGLLLVLLLAAALRLTALEALPPGLHFDEAANLFDILEVHAGARPIFFPRNNGREPLFIYWQALLATALGPTPLALRVAGALVGIATIAAVAFCARSFCRLVGLDPHRGSLWAALILTGTYWHLHFSRLGLRTISLPLFLLLALGFLFRAIARRRTRDFLGAGLMAGLSLYTYHAARLLPLLLAPLILWLLLRARSWRTVAQVGGLLGLATVVFAPLGWYYLQHPAVFLFHSADVSVLSPQVHRGDPLGALLSGLLRTAALFFWWGAESGAENLPGRPLYDPALALLFLSGLAAALVASLRPGWRGRAALPPGPAWPYRFLLWWLVVMALPAALTVNPPGFVRISGLVPAATLLTALGALVLETGLTRLTRSHRRLATGLPAVLIGLGLGLTVRDYFIRWGGSDIAYGWMMADKVEAAAYLVQWAQTDRVFLAPLYAQDFTIRFLTRTVSLESFDIGASLVVPSARERPVTYAFPAFDRDQPPLVLAQLPPGAQDETVYDRSGRRPLLRRLRLPVAALPAPPTRFRALFGSAIALVEEHCAPAAEPRTLRVEFRWFARTQPAADATVFVHLRDGAEKTWAQRDSPPGQGSRPTSSWRPGDYMIDRYWLQLPPEAPGGRYKLVVGLYLGDWRQRLPVARPDGAPLGTELDLGRVEVGPAGMRCLGPAG